MSELRIMSFNIRGSFVDDGENVWPSRRELALEVIENEAPDLVGFQEVQEGNWSFFGGRLAGFRGAKGPRYNNAEPFCYPSVFWRDEVLEVVEQGEFWLSETPEVFSASWDTACIRSALWLRFRSRVDGREFLHVNTHLDHVSEAARLNGARLILERSADLAGGAPRVLTGDFNCEPGSPVHRLFLDGGFQDAHQAAGGTDGPEVFTFHAFTGARKLGRIDWVLTAGNVRVHSCRIVTRADPPLFPSDHYPVVAEVAL